MLFKIVNLQNHAFSGLPYCRDLSLRDNLIKYEKIENQVTLLCFSDIMPNVFKGFGKSVPEMPGGRNIIDLRNNELYTILDDWVGQNLTRLSINCFLDFRFWTSDGRVRRIL